MRRVVVVLAVLILGGCTSSPSAAPSTPGTAPGTSTSVISSAPTLTPAVSPAAAANPYRITSSEASCAVADLVTHFGMGGMATGSDMARILVRNISAHPCALRGAVSYRGLDSTGRVLSSAVCPGSGASPSPTVTACASNVSLPAHTPLSGGAATPGVFFVGFQGFERDDPKQLNALCRRQDEVIPFMLRLTLGTLVLDVRNYDPTTPVTPNFPERGVYGCHGLIALVSAAINS